MSLEERVPKDHPLRTLRALVDGILANMSALFDERYSHTGRPSIPPEQLLRALLVQILFTIRSERQLVEQLDYNLLFRWFVGLARMHHSQKTAVFRPDLESYRSCRQSSCRSSDRLRND